jgi:hypothetical protein
MDIENIMPLEFNSLAQNFGMNSGARSREQSHLISVKNTSSVPLHQIPSGDVKGVQLLGQA